MNRQDPAEAEAVIERLTASVERSVRDECLAFMVKTIRQVASDANDRWGVTLTQDWIRINVGWVESLVLDREGLQVLVAGKPNLRIGVLNERPYAMANGARLYSLSFSEVTSALAEVEPTHRVAVASASQRKTQPTIRRAHSQGFVEFLWTHFQLPRPTPRPAYDGARLVASSEHLIVEAELAQPGAQAQPAGRSWSRQEVEAVVADYLQMLALELAGQSYNKTTHRAALRSKLDSRSDGSIERKHQNISAILLELRVPWIMGYKPLGNYQELLFDVVLGRVMDDARFDELAMKSIEQPTGVPTVRDYADLIVPAPQPGPVREAPYQYQRRRLGIKRDYLELETRNRSLGDAGEDFIVGYEQHRLRTLGEKRLADRVERVSVTKGDGLGYDVLSFETTGRERLIEVKTTAFGSEAPFFVSRQELSLSEAEPDHFVLCRLYQFRQRPRMFELPGAIGDSCQLDPVSYLARF